jgi:hypothetical protein
MRAMLSPTLRRRELAAQLRRLRTDRGLTQKQVAKRLDWSPTKMSRIEMGHRGKPADAGFAPDDGLCGSHQAALAQEVRPSGTKLRARAAARATPYLESMLSLSVILDEAVLHREVACGAVMRAQLEQIIRATCLPDVTMWIVPFAVGAHPAMDSTFIILESTATRRVRCMLRGP